MTYDLHVVAHKAPDVIDLSRVLGDCGAPGSGATLVCVGGLHGNEPSGVLALRRVFEELRAERIVLRGRFVGVAGNLMALAAGRRYLSYDLNRIWWRARVDRIRRAAGPLPPEEEELRELDILFDRLRREAEGRLWFIDLHSTSAPTPPFVTFEDNLLNREFASRFPAPHVLGLEEELVGTLEGYLSSRGVITVGFEAGQHDDPGSVNCAEAAVWIALEASGLLPSGPRVEAARQLLAPSGQKLPRVVEVRHRHPVVEGDGFRMIPGLEGFQPIRAGTTVAMDTDGPVTATQDGLLFMPLYQEQGDDGFFVIRRVRAFWLTISAALRRLHLERCLHWLPGVERHPELPWSFIVDRSRARWLALQIFHLLGFKRLGQPEPQLVMCRRTEEI